MPNQLQKHQNLLGGDLIYIPGPSILLLYLHPFQYIWHPLEGPSILLAFFVFFLGALRFWLWLDDSRTLNDMVPAINEASLQITSQADEDVNVCLPGKWSRVVFFTVTSGKDLKSSCGNWEIETC